MSIKCNKCSGKRWYVLSATKYLLCIDCGNQQPNGKNDEEVLV